MSRAVTAKVVRRERDVSPKAAVRARRGSRWDDLLGSASTDAPSAHNVNIRKVMRSKRSWITERLSAGRRVRPCYTFV